MPSVVNQSKENRESLWLALARIAVVQLLVLLALAGAVFLYVSWSSDAAVTEFMRARPPLSGLNLRPPSQPRVQTVDSKAICTRKIRA